MKIRNVATNQMKGCDAMVLSVQTDVIPAKAGIQSFQIFPDPGFRRGDGMVQ